MPKEPFLSDFSAPWCRALYATCTPLSTPSRNPPEPNPQHSSSLFANTLNHSTGLRAVQTFVFSDAQNPEWRVLYSLGTGLNGPAGILHGGMLMALLDSAMASFVVYLLKGTPIVTVDFRAKFRRMGRGPCIVLARCKKANGSSPDDAEQNGDILRISSTLEDAEGKVLVEATAEFAERKRKGEGAKAKL